MNTKTCQGLPGLKEVLKMTGLRFSNQVGRPETFKGA